VAIFIVVVAITYLSLVVGELVPKRIALANPERTAALVAPSMQVLSRIAAPAVWLLRTSSDAVLRVLGISGTPREVVTEEEVKALIAEGTRAGVFAPQEHRMIQRVLRLADRSVSVIMTHRTDIAWLDRSADRAEVAALVEESTHSHFLVCDGSVEKAVGVVSARDLLRVALRGEPIDISKLALPTLFVSGSTTVLKLIDLIRREAVHAAIVVDEYGTTEGMVTATDILEGIAGSLPERGMPEEPMIVRRPDGSWLIDGLMPIDEFEDACSLPGLRDLGDFHTVAGFVVHSLGRLPKVGDRVERDDATFEVIDMDGRRIDKVLVTRRPIAS
jgi:putative hemolysin